MSHGQILRVAINVPLSRLFDYLAPSPGHVPPGCRVSVPFGRRTQIGMVMEISGDSDLPIEKLKHAKAVLDENPLLSEIDLWLIRFTSAYYHHPIGEVVAAALPMLLRQGKARDSLVRKVSVTPEGARTDLNLLRKRARRQAELLALLQDAESLSFTELDETMPGWRPIRASLIRKSLLEEFETTDDESRADRLANVEQEIGPTLNADQKSALKSIRGAAGFHSSVIDGVTGSGKTEVYLHLIQDELKAGRQVLVVVPEIGLTPQLVSRFRRRLGLEPVLMHSGLTDLARLATWRAAESGRAGLILGTRSAIFIPLKNPGLIIIDEEHDGSLKQQEGLRYSARDLAVVRAKKLGIPVVLGSATPSLETLQRCDDGAYNLVRLPTRAGKAVPPMMRLVDLAKHDAYDGLSQPVVDSITKTISHDGQILIFLNRRGFAPTLICSGCGNIAECTRCDSRMTVHAASNLLKCHHCGAQRRIDSDCADCGSPCRPLGHGTERLEDALRSYFPNEVITRIDSDSTRLKGSMSKALTMATSGETRILIGTQMLSKGHHFPKLTLVVVVNADQGLFSTDFRGGERLAQSLVQVGGRAGREERQGEVIIQTAFPDHPFWSELFNGGYPKVARSALVERESAGWPPFSRLALIRAAATSREDAHRFLTRARKLADATGIDGVRILGPVSAPMERKAGRFRAQLLLQSRQRGVLHQVLTSLRPSLESSTEARRVRWSIDVDPIELF
ncbi:MAG: primosomal protein N' [Proteobacteria bacterium]|nr:primosomal protein N' [Pseudomonadota bacterium]